MCGSRTVSSSTIVRARFESEGACDETSSKLICVPGTCTTNEKNVWPPIVGGFWPSDTHSQLSCQRNSMKETSSAARLSMYVSSEFA